MKILLPVIGVRGDVQIFLSLAKGLVEKGHDVTVALPEKFITFTKSVNIKSFSLGGTIDDGVRELQAIMKTKSTLDAAKLGISFFFEGIRKHTGTLQKLIPDFDLVIGYGSFGLAEADKAGKPFISVVIDPAMAEKQMTSNIGLNIGLLVEKLALHFLMTKEYRVFRQEIQAPIESISKNPRKVLLPMSHHIITKQKNWTEKNIISGFWYLPSAEDYNAPDDLRQFLQSSEIPVFITFGSAGWSETDNVELLKIFFNALEISRKRAIILLSSPQLLHDIKKPDNVYIVNEIPYQWIMKQVSCVIHHCGMGTTAEVLQSGIPSIPVPHMIDQFAWAKRIHSIGVSTKPISRKELTAQSLANAITEAVSNTQIKDKAKAISEQINSENGIADAVRAIEDAML